MTVIQRHEDIISHHNGRNYYKINKEMQNTLCQTEQNKVLDILKTPYIVKALDQGNSRQDYNRFNNKTNTRVVMNSQLLLEEDTIGISNQASVSHKTTKRHGEYPSRQAMQPP